MYLVVEVLPEFETRVSSLFAREVGIGHLPLFGSGETQVYVEGTIIEIGLEYSNEEQGEE